MICTSSQSYSGGQIEKNEMVEVGRGGACSMYG